jgi:hypothetical protein
MELSWQMRFVAMEKSVGEAAAHPCPRFRHFSSARLQVSVTLKQVGLRIKSICRHRSSAQKIKSSKRDIPVNTTQSYGTLRLTVKEQLSSLTTTCSGTILTIVKRS